jgi:transposase
MSTSVTRKTLNLDDKVKAINLCDGVKSCRAVAEEMGVGRTQIMNIIKRKSEIPDDFNNNMPGSRKRQRRATGNEDITSGYYLFFK